MVKALTLKFRFPSIKSTFLRFSLATPQTNDDVLRQVLHDYFRLGDRDDDVPATIGSPDDVPKGLSIPHWSWDGLQV